VGGEKRPDGWEELQERAWRPLEERRVHRLECREKGLVGKRLREKGQLIYPSRAIVKTSHRMWLAV